MPPYVQLFDVLSDDEHAELRTWAIGHQSAFEPAQIDAGASKIGGRIEPGVRTAFRLNNLGTLHKVLRERFMSLLPRIMDATGYHGPPPTTVEFELNAYGDGGHFKQHIDTLAGKPEDETRILSAVYYFCREPKGFSGGALRLFRFGVQGDDAGPDDVVAFQPEQNSLVAFPSWAPHRVDRVTCQSGRFEDFRFALNVWFCRKLGN